EEHPTDDVHGVEFEVDMGDLPGGQQSGRAFEDGQFVTLGINLEQVDVLDLRQIGDVVQGVDGDVACHGSLTIELADDLLVHRRLLRSNAVGPVIQDDAAAFVSQGNVVKRHVLSGSAGEP